MKYKTDEERKAARRIQSAEYRVSPAGRASQAKYKASEKGRATNAWYVRTRKIGYIIKLGGECNNCGLKYTGKNAAVFDFHHRHPTKKSGALRMGGPKEGLDTEVKKCDLLCANCHRLHHAEEY